MEEGQKLSNSATRSAPTEMQRALVQCRCFSSNSPAASLNLVEARQLLSKYPGGKVDVVKNEKTGIATVCLNRPDKKNAISGQLLLELDQAADGLASWSEGKGFLLYGSGQFFCSGGDLKMSAGVTTFDGGLLLARFAHRVFAKLKSLPLVSAAFVEGSALGGGAEMSVAACDWILMRPEAKIGFVHSKMWLNPGWGGAEPLRERVGPSRALELICSGRLLAAPEAATLGLATGVVENFEEAVGWLEARVSAPARVVRACKQAATQGGQEAAAQTMAKLWSAPEKLEVLSQKLKHK